MSKIIERVVVKQIVCREMPYLKSLSGFRAHQSTDLVKVTKDLHVASDSARPCRPQYNTEYC